MEIHEFILTVLGLVVAIAVLMYVVVPRVLTHKSPRFRLIKTSYTYDQSTYTPQVKIGGIWLYIDVYEINYISIYKGSSFLDPQDALDLIEEYKKTGSFSLPSNRKLNSNEKQINVE